MQQMMQHDKITDRIKERRNIDYFSKGSRDLPKRAGTDSRKYRNGLKWVPKRTGMDISEYRNGPGQASAHTKTDLNGSVGARKTKYIQVG